MITQGSPVSFIWQRGCESRSSKCQSNTLVHQATLASQKNAPAMYVIKENGSNYLWSSSLCTTLSIQVLFYSRECISCHTAFRASWTQTYNPLPTPMKNTEMLKRYKTCMKQKERLTPLILQLNSKNIDQHPTGCTHKRNHKSLPWMVKKELIMHQVHNQVCDQAFHQLASATQTVSAQMTTRMAIVPGEQPVLLRHGLDVSSKWVTKKLEIQEVGCQAKREDSTALPKEASL